MNFRLGTLESAVRIIEVESYLIFYQNYKSILCTYIVPLLFFENIMSVPVIFTEYIFISIYVYKCLGTCLFLYCRELIVSLPSMYTTLTLMAPCVDLLRTT